ncbi:hypothetical protein [Acidomonas methanolica]|uniref:hypothetical protein n=1 Tax=Acidomonas methanolica TaxID=437 RepID=UPI00211A536B|nr:hypothetical protein [Acidomonas methanolica]MCQ9156800.1 hypothetical protein [Acidomonas methanolica]
MTTIFHEELMKAAAGPGVPGPIRKSGVGILRQLVAGDFGGSSEPVRADLSAIRVTVAKAASEAVREGIANARIVAQTANAHAGSDPSALGAALSKYVKERAKPGENFGQTVQRLADANDPVVSHIEERLLDPERLEDSSPACLTAAMSNRSAASGILRS